MTSQEVQGGWPVPRVLGNITGLRLQGSIDEAISLSFPGEQ